MKNLLIFFFSIFISFSAFALDLQQAKDQGLVGEANNGFVAPVTSRPSQDVKNLITTVNKRRTERFKKIAVSHGLTAREVGQIAHKKAVEKTERGHYYQNASGKWVKK